MENLCLNPTRNTNVYAHTPVPNFSEQGLRFQRGYSHGYNILTGEAYSPELKKNNQNVNNNNYNNMSDNKAKEQMKKKRNIFSVSEEPNPQPKYNNEPLTNAD